MLVHGAIKCYINVCVCVKANRPKFSWTFKRVSVDVFAVNTVELVVRLQDGYVSRFMSIAVLMSMH